MNHWEIQLLALILGLITVFSKERYQLVSWFTASLSIICIIYIDCISAMLFADVLLQFVILATVVLSVVVHFRFKGRKEKHRLSRLSRSAYLPYLTLVVLLSGALGFVFFRQGVAFFPFADSLKSVMGIFALFLMIYGNVEAWVFWMLTYSIASTLYFITGHYLLTALMLAFIIESYNNYRQWLQILRLENT